MNNRLLKPNAIMKLVRQYGVACWSYRQAEVGGDLEYASEKAMDALEELIERRIRAALGESQ